MSAFSFLHKPLPPLRLGAALVAFWRWERQGLSYLVPFSWRQFRFRPRVRLVSAADETALTVEQSMFGVSRSRTPTARDARLPMRVALAPRDVFETALTLPQTARNDLRAAVSFRIEELSPLPADEVLFAVGPATTREDGRIDVPLAITRKSAIDEVARKFRPQYVYEIGAVPEIDGALRYRFWRPARKRLQPTRLVDVAAVVFGVIALSLGALTHAAALSKALDAQQHRLVATLRAHIVRAKPFNDATKTRTALSVGAVDAEIARVEALLPRPSFIESIEIDPQATTVVYFARADAGVVSGAVIEPRPLQRRGFASYRLVLKKEPAPR